MVVKLPDGSWINPSHVRRITIDSDVLSIQIDTEYHCDENASDSRELNTHFLDIPVFRDKSLERWKQKELFAEEVASLINGDVVRAGAIRKMYEWTNATDEELLSQSVEILELNQTAMKCIVNAGIETLRELVEYTSFQLITELPGSSMVTSDAICEALEKVGLSSRPIRMECE